ncbi:MULTISPECIES: hypothetical protein [unclassified Psychrobacillus]|uniref:hypothetical protein n=1 Tax=unclassified Psychrobacillus TaxID=2636677 RepID=UPI0030FD1E98
MNRPLPRRLILSLGEIKKIGIFEDFCSSEQFEVDGIISRVSEEAIFAFDSNLLPIDYVYEVPKGYIIQRDTV